MNYPEHEKLSAIKDQSQAIGEFLEWLQGSKSARLLTWHEADVEEPCTGDLMLGCNDGNKAARESGRVFSRGGVRVRCDVCKGTGKVIRHEQGYVPVGSTQDLLAEFFEIDQAKLEQEKCAMLDGLRARHEEVRGA